MKVSEFAEYLDITNLPIFFIPVILYQITTFVCDRNMIVYTKFIRLFSCYPNMYSTSVYMLFFYAIPIYILVLIVLYKNRKIEPFDSIFFQNLVLPLGIVDILQVAHSYAFAKFPAFGWFSDFYIRVANITQAVDGIYLQSPEGELFPSYGQFSAYTFGLCQYFGITLTSLNRFMALKLIASPVNDMVCMYM